MIFKFTIKDVYIDAKDKKEAIEHFDKMDIEVRTFITKLDHAPMNTEIESIVRK